MNRILINIFCTFALEAAACEFDYLGVIGTNAERIGVFSERSSGRTYFVRTGDKVNGCSARTLSIAPNKIVLSEGDKLTVLRPQGSSLVGAESKVTIVKDDWMTAAYSSLEKQAELADDLVLAGEISEEEVKRMFAEEQAALDYLELIDEAFAAKGIF